MDASATINLMSCVGQLIVAALVFLDQRRNHRDPSPVALPLGVLALDVFAWNFFEFAYATSGEPTWHYLDLSFSPFSPPLVFLVVASFTGQRRRLRALVAGAFLVFGVLSLCAAGALFWPPLRAWVDSSVWSGTFVGAILAVTLISVALLLRNIGRAVDRAERRRSAVVLAAMLVGMGLTTTDLWRDLGFQIPALGNLATLIGMTLMTIASLRFKFLGYTPSAQRAWASAVIAGVGVGLYVVAFRWLAANRALLAITTATIAAIVVLATRALMTRWVRHKNRLESLANLGKFSAQLAHDLQNPLAASKGAVQFLRQEVVRGGQLIDHLQFLELMERQVDRMSRVVADYRRLGRAEPAWQTVDLNETVRAVLALQSFASRNMRIETDLADHLPRCHADPDLLSAAFENLVRNAAEAMADGGRVVVRTAMVKSFGFRRAILLSVNDSGVGMDPQQLDRAFEPFFTTKGSGSGLGLAYVRRVVTAHRGRVRLSSRRGSGTTVTIQLPAS